jgi:tRNA A-37 threonylcarbamoyl transferase component Bud32
MIFIHCNTSASVVKTRIFLVGLLFFWSQAARAELPPNAPAASPREKVVAEALNDDDAYATLTDSVGKIQSNADEKTKLAEQQRANPGDRALAAQIKAIDAQNAAMVEKADSSAAKFPGSDKVQRAAGAVAIQAGDYKKGLAYADRAVALAEARPDDPKALAAALRTRATGALWSGDYPKAAADAQRVLKTFPDDKSARSIYEMAKGRAKNGVVGIATTQSRPMANALVESSLLDDPRLREAGRRAGDRAAAIKRTETAMRFVNAGDGARALAAANAAVESDPTLADGYMIRGLAYTILKEFAAALREFTKAIDLWSAQGKKENLPVAYGRRAEANNEARDYPNALRDAEKAVSADAGLGLGYFERARALEGLGEKGERILADFQRAAELTPQYAAEYAAARTRLSAAEPAPAPSRPSRGPLRLIFGAASTLAAVLLFLYWRLTRRARPEERIGFAGERKELDSQYDITAPLGEGGMGMVYKGWDKVLKRPVAIKKLRSELQSSPRERERFLKEAEMVASLHHPHIVDIYTIIRDSRDTYLVFEYVSGVTLHELLNESPDRRLAPARALEILRQIGEAVDHAHSRHVIHRDMKPSNVMLADGGWVKVMDFGIARQVLDSLLTTTKTIVGTPVYMSPEQAMGVVVKESDVFALGVTLYELLTGTVPFKGPGEMSDKMEGRFTPPSALVPGLGQAIDEVLRKALCPRPEDRFHRCGDLHQAAVRALNGEVTPAGPR